MDAWLDRMKQNGGIIPSFVDLDGTIGGPAGKWWGNAYGWGFSPVNPVTGKRENRNRIPRALVGFNNALWVTGDQKYVDAWRRMIDAVNANAQTIDGRTQYPTMYGARRMVRLAGAAMERRRAGGLVLVDEARGSGACRQTRGSLSCRARTRLSRDGAAERSEGDCDASRAHAARHTTAAERLADNMMDFNPAAVDAIDPTDARRPAAGTGRRLAERAPPLLRSGASTRRPA